MSAVPTATLEPQSKRRAAAAAAMHGAAAALADEDAVDDVMEEMASGGPGGGEVAAEKEGEAPHPPLPPGFKVSAPEPQVMVLGVGRQEWHQLLQPRKAAATRSWLFTLSTCCSVSIPSISVACRRLVVFWWPQTLGRLWRAAWQSCFGRTTTAGTWFRSGGWTYLKPRLPLCI